MKTSLLSLGLLLPLMGCSLYLSNPDGSEDRIDINIPSADIQADEVRQVINLLDTFIVEGESEVALADVAGQLTIPGEFQGILDKVLASRNETAQVTCYDRRCKIVSKGTATDFTVDGVSIPVLGTPSIFIAKDIEIYAEVSEDLQRAEICSVKGINVKSGFLKPSVDGALIELDGDVIKTLKVDAGVGGSYPTTSCVPVAPAL